MISGASVWSWPSDGYLSMSQAQRDAADAFVRAHGIRPDGVMIGTVLAVIDADDGSGYWLRTWRAVRDGDGDAYLNCPHCPACVQQVQVVVRLASPPPDLPGAYFDPRCGLRLGEIDDAGSQTPQA